MRYAILVLCLAASIMSNVAAGDVEVMSGGKVIADGGTWAIPMNSGSSKVALFSEQRELFSIYNKSDAPLTIDAIILTPDETAVEEEWLLQTTDNKPQPLAFEPAEVAPGKSFDFYVRYYPVQSLRLKAELKIQYGGDKAYTWTVSAAGRDKALFSEVWNVEVQKVFGGPDTDEMITGMAADSSGNCYVYGQVTSVQDKFAYDLFYGKVTPAGELAWAKLWHGPFRDAARDPGQNDETGGSANAIDVDEQGQVYLAGAVSPGKTNNNFSALIMKVDPGSGEPVWEKLWRPAWPDQFLAKHGAEAYGLDVAGGHVYVTGTTGGGEENSNGLVFLLVLNAADGSLVAQRYLDPTPKTTDRGYAVRADGKGSVYVGGLAAKVSLLIKWDVSNPAAPKALWAETVETGWGSNIPCLDIAQDGTLCAAFDRRGAKTEFSFGTFTADGSLQWAKTYIGGSNKNNNCAVVRAVGDTLYVGGRTGQGWYDAQMGDGKLLTVNLADGALKKAAFHFCGKGPDELAEHRVKGIALQGNTVYLLGQVYTGNMNGVRYSGYWYEGVSKLADYKPAVKPIALAEDAAKDMPEGAVRDAASARKLVDAKALLPWQDATAKRDGKGPDGEMIWWKLQEKK